MLDNHVDNGNLSNNVEMNGVTNIISTYNKIFVIERIVTWEVGQ